MKYQKVIIWGHPFGSHTHSYVHEGFYRAFKHLGYDTYWFHDHNFPKDFNYNDCLFITEGFACREIPILKTSCYAVMYCPDPSRFQEAGHYIDMRSTAYNFKDHIYDYSVNENCQTVGPTCFFEPKRPNSIRFKNNHVDKIIDDFDKFYLGWCSNLLPHEINLEDRFRPRKQVIHFCGSLGHSGQFENYSAWAPFIQKCYKHQIQFVHNCPWQNPLSTEEVIRRVQESILAPDIRGPEHCRTGVITCRLFKNISYGHLGMTNSKHMADTMPGLCIYHEKTDDLFELGMANSQNFDIIKEAMLFVKDNHTYINRITSLLKSITLSRP